MSKATLEDQTSGHAGAARKQRIESGLVHSKIFRSPARGEEGILGRMGVYGIPGLSVAVLQNREIDWAEGFGVREVGKSDPVTLDTMFQCLSVAKIVSAIGILRLSQEGSYGLDDDVNEHLKAWKLKGPGGWKPVVTIRQLLAHTGGMAAFGSACYPRDADLPTLDQVLDGVPPAITAPIQVLTMPGVCYQYAGSGYCVLQKLVEDKTGMPFDEAMRTLVLEPLEKANSTFSQPLPEKYWDRAAVGHHTLASAPAPEKWLALPEMASSGLWSTATDLCKAIVEIQTALISPLGKVLNSAMAVEMVKRHAKNAPVGLGLFTHHEGDPVAFYFNLVGAHRGYRATLMGYVLGGNGAVVLVNNGLIGLELTNEILGSVANEYGWKKFIENVDPPEGLPDSTLSGDYELGGALFSVHITRDAMELIGPNQKKPLILKRCHSGQYKAEDINVTVEPSPTEWSSLVLRQNELEWTLTRRTSRKLK